MLLLLQPNVYANLQRRKMSRFGGFHRKAVIIFPTEEEHKTRAAKRIEEQGKEYSPVNEEEMRCMFVQTFQDTNKSIFFLFS